MWTLKDFKSGILLALIILPFIAACVGPASESSPYWPTEGWRTSSPEQQGMDSEQLAEMLDFLQGEKEDFNVHSILIIRNGYIVTDAYFYPFAPGFVHDIASATESFISTLIGIAIAEGYITSLQQPVLEFFPERNTANAGANKEAMVLEDLLTMRSGFECISQPNEATLDQMMKSPDWAQFVLNLPVAEEPGTHYIDCSLNAHLLSAVIQEATGMSALEFAQQQLFGPLGISDVIWPSDSQDNNLGWSELRMTPHDMAKLGLLYLQGGDWDSRQILPSAWVAAATNSIVSLPTGRPMADSLGYSWYSNSDESYYFADGRSGQRIIVLPDLDMVVVTTGGSGQDPDGVLETLLTSYIIPAAESATPLPANSNGKALLESRINQVALTQDEPEPVASFPDLAQRLSGWTYSPGANPFDITNLGIEILGEDEALFRLHLSSSRGTEWMVVGLDNVFRISSGRLGLPTALKGGWESDNVFIIYWDEIGNINRYQIKMTFRGDQAGDGSRVPDEVIIRMQEMSSPDVITFSAELDH